MFLGYYSSQADVEVIKTKLQDKFSNGLSSAFTKLSSIKWTGQQVDVFANEIRRLAVIARFTNESNICKWVS